MSKHIGTQSIRFSSPPYFSADAAVVGKKEGEGPLRERFDFISTDSYFGQKSWEKAESAMLKKCYDTALKKSGMK